MDRLVATNELFSPLFSLAMIDALSDGNRIGGDVLSPLQRRSAEPRDVVYCCL